MTEVGYEKQIRPLFTERDREEMAWAFDLHDYAAVRENAAVILERLAIGSMPCDEPWLPDWVALFRRWVQSGMKP